MNRKTVNNFYYHLVALLCHIKYLDFLSGTYVNPHPIWLTFVFDRSKPVNLTLFFFVSTDFQISLKCTESQLRYCSQPLFQLQNTGGPHQLVSDFLFCFRRKYRLRNLHRCSIYLRLTRTLGFALMWLHWDFGHFISLAQQYILY